MSKRSIAAQKSARKRKRGNPKRGNPKKKRKAGNPVAKKKRRGRSRGSGGIASNKKKIEIFVAGTALGYAEQKFAFMQQVPTIAALGANLTKGILLALIAKNTGGKTRKWADNGSVAYLGASGLDFGRNNFQLSGPGQEPQNMAVPGEHQILGEVVAGDMEE
jgi:hypothetical protein